MLLHTTLKDNFLCTFKNFHVTKNVGIAYSGVLVLTYLSCIMGQIIYLVAFGFYTLAYNVREIFMKKINLLAEQ